MRLEDAVGNPQPAHIGGLCRRDVEHAVIAPAEIIRRRRRGVVARLRLQSFVGIEGMLFAFELLRIGQLLAVLEHTVLRFQMHGIGAGGLSIGTGGGRPRPAAAPSEAPRLHPGHEPFQVTLLFVAKIGRHGLVLHQSLSLSS